MELAIYLYPLKKSKLIIEKKTITLAVIAFLFIFYISTSIKSSIVQLSTLENLKR